MRTITIQCLACLDKGHMEVRGLTDMVPEFRMFRPLGHNAATGHMLYICPHCSSLLRVDPVELLGKKTVMGFPEDRNFSDVYDYRIGLAHDIRNPGKIAKDSSPPGSS